MPKRIKRPRYPCGFPFFSLLCILEHGFVHPLRTCVKNRHSSSPPGYVRYEKSNCLLRGAGWVDWTFASLCTSIRAGGKGEVAGTIADAKNDRHFSIRIVTKLFFFFSFHPPARSAHCNIVSEMHDTRLCISSHGCPQSRLLLQLS